MQLLRRPGSDASRLPGPCVATIGTFDGVHLGHQRILERVREEARARELPSVVLSFEPTPREFFSRSAPPGRLTRFREKFGQLAGLGIDYFFCPPFDAAMENLTPGEFVEQLLVRTLAVRHLVIGDDFVFAKNRAGNADYLRAAGPECGFSVEQVGSVVERDQRISSTAIRESLRAGDMEAARRLLGRYYSMTGRVVPGNQLGKNLGYPTANVSLKRRSSPVSGIFAVRVGGLPEGLLDGVASVGTRPTVDGTEPLLEVHLFDFDRDIYGAGIEVQFVARLRDEEKFPDLESLVQQMHIDAAEARSILAP